MLRSEQPTTQHVDSQSAFSRGILKDEKAKVKGNFHRALRYTRTLTIFRTANS